MLAACEPMPAESLASVPFDDGVRLDVHRSLVVEIVGGRGDERIALRLPDGSPLYRGLVGPLAARPLATSVPPGIDALVAEIDGAFVDVPVADGVARLDLAGVGR